MYLIILSFYVHKVRNIRIHEKNSNEYYIVYYNIYFQLCHP